MSSAAFSADGKDYFSLFSSADLKKNKFIHHNFFAVMKIRKNIYLLLSLLLFCLSMKAHLSFAADTISANQSLSGDQTIVSKGGKFELGFFKPGRRSNYYIGIWYKRVSESTFVWVANREAPVSDINSSRLTIQNGNLVLLDESQSPIWSTNVSSTSSSSVMAILLDDGNLKLIDRLLNISSAPPIWQSFDNPTDTFLPGGKLSYNKITNTKHVLFPWRNFEDPAPGPFSLELLPHGKEYALIWNGTREYWTSGEWNGRIFSLVPEMRYNYIYNFSYIDNENESYFTYSMYDPTIISRLTIDFSGQIKQYTWLDNSKQWNMFWAQPREQCRVYAYCGPFAIAICNENFLSSCGCLQGYKPKSYEDWNKNDFSSGCVRETTLQCENNSSTQGQIDKFWKLNWVRLPDGSRHVVSLTGGAAECESLCLGSCPCTAYSYESNLCSTWDGELLNLQKLSAGDGNGRTLHLRLDGSDFSSQENSKETAEEGIAVSSSKPKSKMIIPITVIVAFLLASSFIYFLFRRRIIANRQGSKDDFEMQTQNLVENNEVINAPFINFESIQTATDNFSDSNKLGQGGFGPVYKAVFPGGKEFAVKRLSSHSGQGIQEFQNEVSLIAKLQHRNLVRLLGHCIRGSEKLLLYEYMINKSLDTFIFDEERCKLLDWEKRFAIILGITKGLLYLHHDSRLRVIHRDLKTSNILLDEELKPKISDFGLARVVGGRETKANTVRVVGTYGYMSPEYALEGLFSIKSDVFSFGVILLEIISGKRNAGFYEEVLGLVGYAWKLWQEMKAMEFIDKNLPEYCKINDSEFLKCMNIGLLCVQEDSVDRPTMANVLKMFDSEPSTLPSPNEPAFISRRRRHDSSISGSFSGKPNSNSISKMTLSAVEGR